MTDLQDIARDMLGDDTTATEEQHDTESDRVHTGEPDVGLSDVQDEYDGGWTNKNA